MDNPNTNFWYCMVEVNYDETPPKCFDTPMHIAIEKLLRQKKYEKCNFKIKEMVSGWGCSKEQAAHLNNEFTYLTGLDIEPSDHLRGAELLFGFVGWLTSRQQVTVMGASVPCGDAVSLIQEFCEENDISTDCRPNWTDALTHPVEGFTPEKRSAYHVEILPGIWIDVYDTLRAFQVKDQAIGHALKKLLKPGNRGDNNKDMLQDLNEAVWSINRAIESHNKPSSLVSSRIAAEFAAGHCKKVIHHVDGCDDDSVQLRYCEEDTFGVQPELTGFDMAQPGADQTVTQVMPPIGNPDAAFTIELTEQVGEASQTRTFRGVPYGIVEALLFGGKPE